MSAESLLTMRPAGCLSKNLSIGARKILPTSVL